MRRMSGLPRHRSPPASPDASGKAGIPDRERIEPGRRRALLGLSALFALEIANGVFLIVRDSSDPDFAMEVSPWISFGVRIALSMALYPFAYLGYRLAWILTWVRVLFTGVLLLLAFDLPSLAFLVPIAASAGFLAFDRDIAAFRRVGRWRRLPSAADTATDDSWSVLGTPPSKGR